MLSPAEDNPAGCAFAPFPEERGHSLGRALKVNKEEIVAMWVAPEHHLKRDHQKDWSEMGGTGSGDRV